MSRSMFLYVFIVLGVVSFVFLTLASINRYRSDTRSRSDGASSQDFDKWERKEHVFAGLFCAAVCLMAFIFSVVVLK